MRTKNKTIQTLLIVSILLGLLLSACGGTEATATTEPADDFFQDFVPQVSATGKVVPAEWATLSVPNAGIVIDLNAEENDEVAAGDLLLRLNGVERLAASISAAQLELISAEQALDTLAENSDLVAAQVAQQIADTVDAVRDAERKLNNLNAGNDQEDIDQAFANVVLTEDKLETARDNFEKYENKSETNLTRAALLSIMSQRENDYKAAVRLYNNMIGAANEIDLGQADADLAYAQALLTNLQADYEKVKDGPDADSLEIANARLANARANIAAAQSTLDDLELTAPFDGTITQLFVRQNEWVNPGQPVLVIGDLSHLQVETTDLNEIDVARIQVGSRATITFDALPDVSIGATVSRIATKSSPGTGVNYTVILELDEIPAGLLWDMTAFVDIEVE